MLKLAQIKLKETQKEEIILKKAQQSPKQLKLATENLLKIAEKAQNAEIGRKKLKLAQK